jgi:very-short-patch-repair endonuclease
VAGHYQNGFKSIPLARSGLIVETDGLRYHRTPAQQAKDRIRDQVHAAAGFTPLRFTRAQVRFEPRLVEATLFAVARRLRAMRRVPGVDVRIVADRTKRKDET